MDRIFFLNRPNTFIFWFIHCLIHFELSKTLPKSLNPIMDAKSWCTLQAGFWGKLAQLSFPKVKPLFIGLAINISSVEENV